MIVAKGTDEQGNHGLVLCLTQPDLVQLLISGQTLTLTQDDFKVMPDGWTVTLLYAHDPEQALCRLRDMGAVDDRTRLNGFETQGPWQGFVQRRGEC